jgi:hypothetical protein
MTNPQFCLVIAGLGPRYRIGSSKSVATLVLNQETLALEYHWGLERDPANWC